MLQSILIEKGIIYKFLGNFVRLFVFWSRLWHVEVPTQARDRTCVTAEAQVAAMTMLDP